MENFKAIEYLVSKGNIMVSLQSSFFSGEPYTNALPIQQESSQSSQFRVRIQLKDLERALPHYAGRIRMHHDLRHHIDSGRMSPKEIISIQGLSTSRKYLIKELPFYVQDPEHFAEKEYHFQDWLAREHLYSPSIKKLHGQSNIIHVDGSPAVLMSFLPTWLNVIQTGKTHQLGKVLSNFHALCRRYPEQHPHVSFEERSIKSINEDLVTWCFDAFKDHCKPSAREKAQYQMLMQQVNQQTAVFKPYTEADKRFIQIVHGEFNLGNIMNKGGAFKVIDFDDIQTNHVAYDICYLCAQLCVFNFASKTMNREMPPSLINKDALQQILKEYIRDYHPDDALALLNRLKADFKHHLGRGILLAFSGKHFHISEMPSSFEKIKGYDQDFAHEIDILMDEIKSNQSKTTTKTKLLQEQFKFYAEKFNENIQSEIKSITSKYYTEHLQAKAKIKYEQVPEIKYMTPLEAMSYRVIINDNKIIPIGHAAKQALHNFDQDKSSASFIIAVDQNKRHYIAPKIKSDDYRIQHSSFTAGKPLRFAGYIEFKKHNYHITSIRCESGHYDFPANTIDDFMQPLVHNKQLTDPAIKAKSFYGDWKALHEFQ